MRRVLTLILTALFTLGVAGSALAQTEEEPTTTSVIAPDSPLFFIQHLLDGWEEFLAFDEAQKAAVLAKIAENRLVEAAQMLAAGDEERATELVEQMEDALKKAAQTLKKVQQQLKKDAAKLESDDEETDEDEETTDQRRTEEDVVAHVLSRLERNLERQMANKERVCEKLTNERAREACEKAFDRSEKGLKNAMERGNRSDADDESGTEGADEDSEADEDSDSDEDSEEEDSDADENDDEDSNGRGNGNGPPATPRGKGRP